MGHFLLWKFIEVYFVEVGIVYNYKLQTPEHQHEYS